MEVVLKLPVQKKAANMFLKKSKLINKRKFKKK